MEDKKAARDIAKINSPIEMAPSQLDTLEYIVGTLMGLREMAKTDGCASVRHFIEMALVEASDTRTRVAKEDAQRRNN